MIQLLKAYAMFQKDVDYIIVDNKVKIVDDRRAVSWKPALERRTPQAVEAKENVKVEAATQTFATITLRTISGCTTSWPA